ncbi:FAD-dependent amino acid oxidase involved in late endosome to Golgi transport Tda3 [Schizosaccharomyces osmophilus]|uniref:FAD-dependent amino acid oxidase involved in late endosome to Golgi transport Tda3 n=1 Tax=Schizosaccharomyces osmophilus TaxID=2545709 RepID=A0AAF0AVY1_9SCHI|nr:FAD-dependent amino acid oxidase involved in late endosome to Golgi transport Tda3 [Schizosaccharomyces osmophilus]WBW72394.1 FAD-dependent amino acid oxidase involved in late endosome to Golgi transport Tda3 [Schizosaccharomyces osmophilus]
MKSKGGIIGICTSFYLTEHELYKEGRMEIIIVESNEVASGSSSIPSALITSQWQNEALHPLTEASVRLHQRLNDLYDGKNKWEFRYVEPWLMNFTKFNDHVSKLPEQFDYFSDEHLQKCNERGVQIIYGKVTDVKNNSVHYVPKGYDTRDTIILDADKVCVSAGAWTGYILPYSGIGCLFAQSLLLDLEGCESKEYVTICNVNLQNPEFQERSVEVHFLPNNKAFITGSTLFIPLPKGNEAIQINSQHLMDLKETFDLLLAEKVKSEVIDCTCAFLPKNRVTGIPILTTSRSGIYIAAGHASWGITQGPATGLWMAELILEGTIKSIEIDD